MLKQQSDRASFGNGATVGQDYMYAIKTVSDFHEISGLYSITWRKTSDFAFLVFRHTQALLLAATFTQVGHNIVSRVDIRQVSIC